MHRLLHQHAIFNMWSGSLKSGYRFVQMTGYRLTSLLPTAHHGREHDQAIYAFIV